MVKHWLAKKLENLMTPVKVFLVAESVSISNKEMANDFYDVLTP